MHPANKPIDTINCPSCDNPIPITETLRRQLAEEAKRELQQEFAERQQALVSKEKDLQAKEARVVDSEKEIANRVTKQVMDEKRKLIDEALKTARAEVSVQMQDLQSRAAEDEQKLRKSEEKELQLLKEKRELESAKQALELDVARRLDSERSQIRDAALEEAAEQHRLKDAEKDQRL